MKKVKQQYYSNVNIKKLRDDQFLLYNTLTKKSYILDEIYVVVILRLIMGDELRKIKRFVEMKGYDFDFIYYKLINTQIINIRNSDKLLTTKYFKFSFVSKLPRVLFYFLFVLLMVTVMSGLYLLFKNPLNSSELYIVPGFSYILVFYVSWFFLTLFHEFAHAFLANYFGCETRIFFKMYFIFPALVTDIPQIVMLKKWKRVVIHSAGMLMDVFLISVSLILAFFSYGWLYHLFRFFAIIKFLSLFSQLQLHFRTDLYFIIEDLFNAINLKREALAFILNKKQHFFNSSFTLLLFVFIMLFGYSMNIYVLLTYVLPGLIGYYHHNFQSKLVVFFSLILAIFYHTNQFISFLKKIKKSKKRDKKVKIKRESKTR